MILHVAKAKSLFAVATLASLCALPLAAQSGKPDAYEDALRDSVKQYRAGKIAEAAVALDKAKVLLDKLKSQQLGTALPDAPEGWSTGEMQTEDVPVYLGGGKVVKKLYRNTKGQDEILLEVYYGSTLIKLMRGLSASEDLAKAQGFELKRAGGEKVLTKKLPGNNWEMNMPTDDEIMIKLTGKDGAKEDDMLKLLRNVDRRGIKSLVKP